MGRDNRPAWWDGAALKREQASLQRLKDARDSRALGRKAVQLRINLTDAEHECEHGEMRTSLHKPEPECGCWPDGAVWALGNRGFVENPEFPSDEPAAA